MIMKTVEATYEDGVLTLDEPVDLATRSRVRVQIEIPVARNRTTGSDLASRRLALPPEKRDLLERVRRLRDEIPRVDFDIVGALRDMRAHG